MNGLYWFVSRRYRHAVEIRKHVERERNAQRDLLSANALEELATGLAEFKETMRDTEELESVQAAGKKLEEVAAKWLRPYPGGSSRENIREFLVSAVLILSIFSFFAQPMKIPSGSAQPTLYGNVTTDLKPTQRPVPGVVDRFFDWFRGVDYHVWTAPEDGVLSIDPPSTTLRFIKTQSFSIGKHTYSIWWPPDDLLAPVPGSDTLKCGVSPGQRFRKGEIVLKLRISSGDRLFVDRLTYNFRRPIRGETIVFASTGIPDLTQNTHYIKRLVGLPGDRIRIGNDRHLIVNGERLDAATPYFEKVYAFRGPPRDSQYSGHVNELVARQNGRGRLAPLFPDETAELVVRRGHYLAFGDNTMNSYDGRAWGDFPREKVVGKAFFVFWPFTERFGLVYR
ncbi:MAG: signal peptidase I [Verrucomicrobia bacterium]|nr:signal peptidase I [Verrucomicrobiota bacterium]